MLFLFEPQNPLESDSFRPLLTSPFARSQKAAPFRDRVVHHALTNIIGPIYERKFIFDSYANRKGKGSHRALDRATYYMRRFDYVLPLDVRQYFPSIDHAILLDILRQTFDDQQLMALAALILEGGKDVHTHTYDMVYFAGDDLLAIMRPRGLPIGNMTSQFWANVYLNGLDHYIKRVLGCKAYLRYVDDMLLFANDKKTLHEWRAALIDYLATLRLTMHEQRAQPRPCSSGLPFLGFQLFTDHRRLKRRNPVNARRRIKKLSQEYATGQIELSQVQSSIKSWIAHAEHGDTWGLRGAILEDIYFSRQSSKNWLFRNSRGERPTHP